MLIAWLLKEPIEAFGVHITYGGWDAMMPAFLQQRKTCKYDKVCYPQKLNKV